MPTYLDLWQTPVAEQPRVVAQAIAAAFGDRAWLLQGQPVWRDEGGEFRRLSQPEYRARAREVIVSRGVPPAPTLADPAPKPSLKPIGATLVNGAYHFRECLAELEGVAHGPWVGEDGALRCARGVHRLRDGRTVWLEWPGVMPGIDDVTDAEAAEALGALTDFEYATEADRAGHVAALFHVVRGVGLWSTPCPLYLVSSTDMCSGKSYLAQVLSALATGTPGAAMLLPENVYERSLMLGAVLRAPPPVLWFDNVASGSEIGGPTLHAALTSPTMATRVVGSSDVVVVDPTRPLWVLTVNRPDLDEELTRRVVPIRLRPKTTPHRNAGLLGDVLDRRAWYLACLARLVWLHRDGSGVASLAGYGQWYRLAGGPAASLVGARPGGAFETPENDQWVELCTEWPRLDGAAEVMTTAGVLAEIDARGLWALQAIAGPGGDRSRVTRLGRWLSGMARRARPVGGWALRRVRTKHDRGFTVGRSG